MDENFPLETPVPFIDAPLEKMVEKEESSFSLEREQ